ncbi:hypothetical protein MY3296_007839 [Beauveria thailandica]
MRSYITQCLSDWTFTRHDILTFWPTLEDSDTAGCANVGKYSLSSEGREENYTSDITSIFTFESRANTTGMSPARAVSKV